MAGGASNLVLRAASACVFVPAILLLVWQGGIALFLLVLGIVGRGSWELFHLLEAGGYRPASRVGGFLSVGLCVYLYASDSERLAVVLVLVVLVCLLASLRRGVERYAAGAFATLGAVLYVGLLGSAPLLIVRAAAAHRQEAIWLLLALFACIWLADAAAYFCGRLWGRRKLAATISPGKTRAGFAAGLGAGLLPLFLHEWLPSFSPLLLAGLLLLAGAGGQVGDLVESAIKRDLGVKDAPALIPGHGGVLDRFDSYLFAFPLAYLYIEGFGIFTP